MSALLSPLRAWNQLCAAVAALLPCAGLLLVVGCSGFGSENAFIGTATLDTCDDEIPICNGTAGCKLVEEEQYIEGTFPGRRALIVPTEGKAVIRMRIYWRTQLGPGADTEIRWNEPACVDTFTYESQGADIFAASNDQGIFQQDHFVFRAGDHLVEILSDATAEFILRTEVLTESEYEQEQNGLTGGP